MRKGQKIVKWLNEHPEFTNQNEGCESYILERVSDEELDKVIDINK